MEKDWVNKYKELLSGLFLGYRKKLKKEKVGVLVSGGIDSSVIAFFAKQAFSSVTLISLQSEKSVDDDYVEILCKHLKSEPLLVKITRLDLQTIYPEIITLLQQAKVEINPMQTALASVYYWLFKTASQQGFSTILTGQGPDILLGGYYKYRQLRGKELKQAIIQDLPLLTIDQKRDQAMAKRWGLKLINPYLAPEVVGFCQTVPPKLIIKNDQEKYLSRALGKKLRLPEILVNRPKKAMQYSTGVMKINS